MKVVLPKEGPTKPKKHYPLPLVPDKEDDILDKNNSVNYELKTSPADGNDSPKYKYNARVLDGTESIRQIIMWKHGVAQVLEGLGLDAIASKQRITETLLKGAPLSIYVGQIERNARTRYTRALRIATTDAEKTAVRDNGINHYRENGDHDAAIRTLFEKLIPKKTVSIVKRNMRREMRKPAEMKVRTYYSHLTRLNNSELKYLPPFQADGSLGGHELKNDEIIDILMYAVPKSWLREADRQGFDPLEHSPEDFVDFLEQIENSEEFDANSSTVRNGDQKKAAKKKSSNASSNKKHCAVHGTGNHSTDECRTVMKALGKDSSESKNKSWNRKAAEAKKKTNEDMKAFVKKVVKAEVHSMNKKRKPDNDLNALESEFDDIDLSKFEEEDILNAIEECDAEGAVNEDGSDDGEMSDGEISV